MKKLNVDAEKFIGQAAQVELVWRRWDCWLWKRSPSNNPKRNDKWKNERNDGEDRKGTKSLEAKLPNNMNFMIYKFM